MPRPLTCLFAEFDRFDFSSPFWAVGFILESDVCRSNISFLCLPHLFKARWFEIWNVALPSSVLILFFFPFFFSFGTLFSVTILSFRCLLMRFFWELLEWGGSNLEGWDRKKMQGFYASSSAETGDNPHLLPRFLPQRSWSIQSSDMRSSSSRNPRIMWEISRLSPQDPSWEEIVLANEYGCGWFENNFG